jgi:hypothetical protein
MLPKPCATPKQKATKTYFSTSSSRSINSSLASIQFDYRKFPGARATDPWISRPVISVHLSQGGRTVGFDALIDSGADSSIFHSQVAEALGIDLKSGLKKAFFGVTGTSQLAYFHPVELQVVGLPGQINILAGFADSPGVGAVLGQADFFQHFQIKFERYKERIEIKPAKN